MALKFRLLGFEVDAHASFLVMGLLLARPSGLGAEQLVAVVSWLLAMSVSILVHELGHAHATRAFGGDARIELYSLGGLTYPTSERPFTNGQNALISAAGPAAGFALGGLVYAMAGANLFPDNAFFSSFVVNMIWVNVGWGALNLLPMLPLDGGHIMRSGFDAATAGKGLVPASIVSIGVSVVATLAALRLGWTWAALIAGWSGASTFQELQRHRAEHSDEPLLRELDRIQREQTTLGATETVRQLEAVLKAARSKQVVRHVATVLAWQHVHHRRADAAAEALSHLVDQKVPDALLGSVLALQQRTDEAVKLAERVLEDGRDRFALGAITEALFYAGAFTDAARIGARTFERFGSADDAYNVACSLARAEGTLDDAASWLAKAVDAGYSDVPQLDADEDLAALRKLPSFAAIRAKAASNATTAREAARSV